jgi:hypothetical protein
MENVQSALFQLIVEFVENFLVQPLLVIGGQQIPDRLWNVHLALMGERWGELLAIAVQLDEWSTSVFHSFQIVVSFIYLIWASSRLTA